MDKVQERAGSRLREAHLRDYWKIAWQGRWTILAVFIVIVGATGVWTYMETPTFQATAIVEIQPKPTQILGGGEASGIGAAGYGWFAEEKYHNTQVDIIKSRDIAQRVVRTLGLNSHPMFVEAEDPVDALRQMIVVSPRRDTGLLEISIAGADRQDITQWTNAVAQAYVDRNFERARANLDNAMHAIQGQMDRFKSDLSHAEEERIGALQESDGNIVNLEKQEEMIQAQLQAYNDKLTEVRIDLSALEGKLRQIRAMQQRGDNLLSLADLSADPALQLLLSQQDLLKRELESAEVVIGEAHPQYKEKEAALSEVQRTINAKVRGLVAGFQSDYDLARETEAYLFSRIQDAESRSLNIESHKSRYGILKTDADMNKQILDMLLMTSREVQLEFELMNNNVSILDQAMVPLYPIAPRKKANLMIGAMFGIFLGLGVVFFLDYLDNTIRTPEDVEKHLGLAVIGVVPKMQVPGADALGERPIKEAYQSLRTSIIFSSKNRKLKRVLVTSTSPREGKSSTVANLGRTLAAAGDRVAIIDCDLRRPKQHLHHGMEREPGLTNYLAAPEGMDDWAEFAKTSKPANLHVYTSGPLPPSPPDLLGNDRFLQMLDAMSTVYDWVLIDSPPAASLADSSLLAAIADMVVMVVSHNSTDRDHVVKTVQQLRAVDANLAGVVLNKVDMDRSHNKDYYYAGYYYEEDGEKEKRFRRKSVEKKAQVG